MIQRSAGLLACSGVLLGWVLLASEVQAQHTPDTAAAVLASLYAQGRQAYEAQQYTQAAAQLEQIFRADPSYAPAGAGSVAYWLGRTYESLDRKEAAVMAWETGWYRQAEAGTMDLELADAYVWHVFTQKDTVRYATAAAAYLAMLEGMPEGPVPPEETVRRRYLGPLALVLSPEVRAETMLLDEAAVLPRLVPGAGARFAAWWRSQDPLPATPQNERLIEHLERCAYAWTHFPDPTSGLGFDDRGRIYVRLGPPSHYTPITLRDGDLDFPKSEFWVYRHVDDAAQYLFIWEHNAAYRLGMPADLIPSKMQLTSNTRSLIKTLEALYRELTLLHPRGHYGFYYERIAEYTNHLAMREFSAVLLQGDNGVPNTHRGAAPQPQTFVQSTFMQARNDDKRAVNRRKEVVPPAFSNTLDPAEHLPVDYRWARFLDDDGTTRTELYWQVPTEALEPPQRLEGRLEEEGRSLADDVLIDLTVLQQTAAYGEAGRHVKRHRIRLPEEDQGHGVRELPVQTFIVRGDTSRYHLALQWDAYSTTLSEGAESTKGPRLKTGVRRIDSLEALSADPGRLELSDLKPLEGAATPTTLEEAPPYVYTTLTPETPLALYFEVYHLTFGPDDRTHYAVTYEVARGGGEGGLLHVRKGQPEHRTSAETAYTGSSRTARETILVDLSGWEGTGTLAITVRVTDKTTGQQVERTLPFREL